MSNEPLRIVHSEVATGFGRQESRIYKEMIAVRDQKKIFLIYKSFHKMLPVPLDDGWRS
jgi:hypothetical protein